MTDDKKRRMTVDDILGPEFGTVGDADSAAPAPPAAAPAPAPKPAPKPAAAAPASPPAAKPAVAPPPGSSAPKPAPKPAAKPAASGVGAPLPPGPGAKPSSGPIPTIASAAKPKATGLSADVSAAVAAADDALLAALDVPAPPAAGAAPSTSEPEPTVPDPAASSASGMSSIPLAGSSYAAPASTAGTGAPLPDPSRQEPAPVETGAAMFGGAAATAPGPAFAAGDDDSTVPASDGDFSDFTPAPGSKMRVPGAMPPFPREAVAAAGRALVGWVRDWPRNVQIIAGSVGAVLLILFIFLFVSSLGPSREQAYMLAGRPLMQVPIQDEHFTSPRMIERGEPVEILERTDNYVLVRNAAGRTGWVEEVFVASQPGPVSADEAFSRCSRLWIETDGSACEARAAEQRAACEEYCGSVQGEMSECLSKCETNEADCKAQCALLPGEALDTRVAGSVKPPDAALPEPDLPDPSEATLIETEPEPDAAAAPAPEAEPEPVKKKKKKKSKKKKKRKR